MEDTHVMALWNLPLQSQRISEFMVMATESRHGGPEGSLCVTGRMKLGLHWLVEVPESGEICRVELQIRSGTRPEKQNYGDYLLPEVVGEEQ